MPQSILPQISRKSPDVDGTNLPVRANWNILMAGPTLLRSALSRRSSQSRLKLPNRSMMNAMYFLGIPLLLIATYKYAPIITALFNSTQAYNLAGQPVRFIGLDNYTRVFGDPSFVQSLQLTFLFVIVKVPLQLILGLLIALFVMDTNRINNFVRSSLFLPTVTPMIVVGLVFSFLFDREIGIINAVLSFFNIDKVSWLLEPRSAQLVVILLSVWRDAGFVMLVFLAGLQGIPTQILEAAQMDGASRWQILRSIQIPLLRRTIQFALIFVTSASFQLFAPIFVVTRGGPQGATDVLAYRIYETAFRFFDWGAANTMSLIVLIILIIVTLIELRISRTQWEY